MSATAEESYVKSKGPKLDGVLRLRNKKFAAPSLYLQNYSLRESRLFCGRRQGIQLDVAIAGRGIGRILHICIASSLVENHGETGWHATSPMTRSRSTPGSSGVSGLEEIIVRVSRSGSERQ